MWGGDAWLAGGSGQSAPNASAEVAWAFSHVDVALAALAYRGAGETRSDWARVGLVKLIQRFPTWRGFEATFSIGLGAARTPAWTGWYQVAIGMRVPLGPFFAGGELSFEQLDILRVAGGMGVAF